MGKPMLLDTVACLAVSGHPGYHSSLFKCLPWKDKRKTESLSIQIMIVIVIVMRVATSVAVPSNFEESLYNEIHPLWRQKLTQGRAAESVL